MGLSMILAVRCMELSMVLARKCMGLSMVLAGMSMDVYGPGREVHGTVHGPK